MKLKNILSRIILIGNIGFEMMGCSPKHLGTEAVRIGNEIYIADFYKTGKHEYKVDFVQGIPPNTYSRSTGYDLNGDGNLDAVNGDILKDVEFDIGGDGYFSANKKQVNKIKKPFKPFLTKFIHMEKR